MPRYRFVVVDPEKYRAFQAWSYRLHPSYAAQVADGPLMPVGHLHGEATDCASADVLEQHGLRADVVED
jgi:hypothetical protein